MTKLPPAWLAASKFTSSKERTAAAKIQLEQLITTAVEHPIKSTPPEGSESVMTMLAGPLHGDDPRASAAAEAALVLCALCLVEHRVLDLRPGSSDLEGPRAAGDRVLSEALSKALRGHNIPSTEGALQSSTYRAGYLAAQARSPGLAEFVGWVNALGVSLDAVKAFATALAQEFGALHVSFPPLPPIDPNSLTFARMKAVIGALRSKQSGGAYEQYLVKALLAQEYMLIHPSWRVETKRIMASDASSGAASDVQVRRKQVLVQAIEVSAANWQTKIAQSAKVAQEQGVQVVIAAPAQGLTGTELETALGGPGGTAAELAVVDLDGLLDLVSSRITPAMRAAAVKDLYRMLIDWGRARPDLVAHLVSVVTGMTSAPSGETAPVDEDVAAALDRMANQADLAEGEVVEVAAEDLRLLLGELDEA
jgi:hypothetical protein